MYIGCFVLLILYFWIFFINDLKLFYFLPYYRKYEFINNKILLLLFYILLKNIIAIVKSCLLILCDNEVST